MMIWQTMSYITLLQILNARQDIHELSFIFILWYQYHWQMLTNLLTQSWISLVISIRTIQIWFMNCRSSKFFVQHKNLVDCMLTVSLGQLTVTSKASTVTENQYINELQIFLGWFKLIVVPYVCFIFISYICLLENCQEYRPCPPDSLSVCVYTQHLIIIFINNKFYFVLLQKKQSIS